MLRPRIVILGAGFGGTYVAKRLSPLVKKGEIELTIVNKTNYFLFTPLLHEVATGSLTPSSVAEPLREIFAHTGVELCQGMVDAINTIDRRVHVIGNGGRHTLIYDYLVIATGAETNYYDIPGAEKLSYPLKNLSDAARIRDRIIDSFEEAIFCEDPADRKRMLSFAVVGGGPTGVETAAEMIEFIDLMVKRYYEDTNCAPDESGHCMPEEPEVALVDAGSELLPQFSPTLRRAALDRLEKAGVSVYLGSPVTAVTSRGLTLSDGTIVPASTVIWSAGVKAVVPGFEGRTPPLVAGRLAVDGYFRVNGDRHAFALGDAAGYVDSDLPVAEGASPKPVPMLAQAAVSEASVVAGNILASLKGKKLRGFHYHSKGSMVSVGQWFAVGEIFALKLAGPFAWWLWRTVYLFKFASWKKRIRIAFEWTINVFYPRDITKLR